MVLLQVAISTLAQVNDHVISSVIVPWGMTNSRTNATTITMMVRKKIPHNNNFVRKGSWILQNIETGTEITALSFS